VRLSTLSLTQTPQAGPEAAMHALRVAIKREATAAAASTPGDISSEHVRNVSSLFEVHVLAPCYATPGLAFLHQGWEVGGGAAADARSGPSSSTAGSDRSRRRFNGHPSVEVNAMGLECAPRFFMEAHAHEAPAVIEASKAAPAAAAAGSATAISAREDCAAYPDSDIAPSKVADSRWSNVMALRRAWQSEDQNKHLVSSSFASLSSASALFEEIPFTVALALYGTGPPVSNNGTAASEHAETSEATLQMPLLPPVATLPNWVITWAGSSFGGNSTVDADKEGERGALRSTSRHELDFDVRLNSASSLAEEEEVLFERWLSTHFELQRAHFHGHAPTQGSKYLLTWKRRS